MRVLTWILCIGNIAVALTTTNRIASVWTAFLAGILAAVLISLYLPVTIRDRPDLRSKDDAG